jgi:Ni,Fe-hydrogenase III small subunit
MVKLWVLRGMRKGILTTKYPKRSPTSEEIPSRSSPPNSTESSDWKKGQDICPTGAIEEVSEREGRIDLGKCIYCQKCSQAGFAFDNVSSDRLQSYFVDSAINNLAYAELLRKYNGVWRTFKRSLHVLMIDVGSCNACNLEVQNLSNPYYDLNRLGIFFTNSPKHADALIVVGAPNRAMIDVLRRVYNDIPEPRVVIAVGVCPISGGIFNGTQSFVSPLREIINVDVEIPGCPPSPIQILHGLLMAMGKTPKSTLHNAPPHDVAVSPTKKSGTA